MRMSFVLPRAAVRAALCASLLAASLSPAAAQIPDKFTNLQVLPKEITRAELIMQMRWFAGALGVRCNHCHVGKNAETLEGFDFASDDKEPKKVARAMMQMVKEINGKLLPATGRDKPHPVSCITCHRGAMLPQTLYELLLETVRKDGVDAALKQYRDQREKHYGDGVYDFSPRTLSALADLLGREGKDLDGALAAARLNAEVNPTKPNVHAMVGQICMNKGDRECAIAAFRKAVELAPDEPGFKKLLEAAQAPPAPPK